MTVVAVEPPARVERAQRLEHHDDAALHVRGARARRAVRGVVGRELAERALLRVDRVEVPDQEQAVGRGARPPGDQVLAADPGHHDADAEPHPLERRLAEPSDAVHALLVGGVGALGDEGGKLRHQVLDGREAVYDRVLGGAQGHGRWNRDSRKGRVSGTNLPAARHGERTPTGAVESRAEGLAGASA